MTANLYQYRAYVFDFDYTLGDSSAGIVLCVNGAMKKMGLPECADAAIHQTIGLTLGGTFRQLTGIGDTAPAERFAAYFREAADRLMVANTVLYPDTIPVLSGLKQSGAKTGIVTTKHHYRIDAILGKFGIRHLIDAIAGIEDVRRAKPDAEGLLRVIGELGVTRGEVLYVGDSVVDAETARNASVDFAAVLTGTTAEDSFLQYPHRHIAQCLSGLFSV